MCVRTFWSLYTWTVKISCTFLFPAARLAHAVYIHIYTYVDGLHRRYSYHHVQEGTPWTGRKTCLFLRLSPPPALRKLCPVLNHGARRIACKPSIIQCAPFFFKVNMHAWRLRAPSILTAVSSCLKRYRFVNVFTAVTTARLFVDCAYLSRCSSVGDKRSCNVRAHPRSFTALVRCRPLLTLWVVTLMLHSCTHHEIKKKVLYRGDRNTTAVVRLAFFVLTSREVRCRG